MHLLYLSLSWSFFLALFLLFAHQQAASCSPSCTQLLSPPTVQFVNLFFIPANCFPPSLHSRLLCLIAIVLALERKWGFLCVSCFRDWKLKNKLEKCTVIDASLSITTQVVNYQRSSLPAFLLYSMVVDRRICDKCAHLWTVRWPNPALLPYTVVSCLLWSVCFFLMSLISFNQV